MARLRALASERPRFGYRRLHVLLRREGQAVNRKLVYRLYKAAGLAVRRRSRRKLRTSRPMPSVVLTRPNECCSMCLSVRRKPCSHPHHSQAPGPQPRCRWIAAASYCQVGIWHVPTTQTSPMGQLPQ